MNNFSTPKSRRNPAQRIVPACQELPDPGHGEFREWMKVRWPAAGPLSKPHNNVTAGLLLCSFSGFILCHLNAAESGTAAATPATEPEVKHSSAAPAKPAPSIYDKIWRYADWYHNEENPVIQRFSFTGRFQLDYAHVDASQGMHDEWNIRRFRLGAKAKLFRHFTLHGEAEINPQEATPAYERLTDMYLAWSRSENFKLTIGKHSAPFTLDGATSSKELLTIDRANLANNLWYPQEYFPGISASGEPGPWRYHAGVYSSGEANKELGEFNGGVFGLAKIGYDFADPLKVKEALLSLDYVYNEPDRNNSFTRSLQHVGSINFRFATGKWGLRSDLAAGAGYLGQSDLWGAMLMPFYNITDKLQAVSRYTYLASDDVNGLRLARYESELVSGRGDEYQEIYIGLNYYFYKHKLKIQTGVQYAEMKDTANDRGGYTGWGWTTGLRIAW